MVTVCILSIDNPQIVIKIVTIHSPMSVRQYVSYAIRETLPDPQATGTRNAEIKRYCTFLADSTCSYPELPPRSDRYFPYGFVPNPGLPSPMSVKSIPAIVDVRVLPKAQNTREKPVFFCIFSIYYRMESGIMI